VDLINDLPAPLQDRLATQQLEAMKAAPGSSVGSCGQPGKSVRQKAALHRAILDRGGDEFRLQLAYNMEWNGGILLAAPPHHTSQTCPA
jgi:transposase